MPRSVGTFRSPAMQAAIRPKQERGSASARGYGRRWQKLSRMFLQSNPLCACGCGNGAEVVDHKVPHRGDQTLFWDVANWQPMTKACHDAKTAREDRLTGRPVA